MSSKEPKKTAKRKIAAQDVLAEAVASLSDPLPLPDKRPKSFTFVSRVVNNFSDADFKIHFRLARSTVETILQILPTEAPSRNRPRTPIMTRLLVTLWALGNRETFSAIADRFFLGKGQTHREFVDMCAALAALAPDVIRWPSEKEQARRVVTGFARLLGGPDHGRPGMPGVIGCLGAVRIQVRVQIHEHEAHRDARGALTVVLQAVCDSQLRLTDAFAGWPGSASNARVFQHSPLCAELRQQPGVLAPDHHLLADNTYPLAPFLLTPYEEEPDAAHSNPTPPLTPAQRHYNRTLASTRACIDHTFGRLFERFRRLSFLDLIRRDLVPDAVMSCCVLHNLCAELGDVPPEAGDGFGEEVAGDDGVIGSVETDGAGQWYQCDGNTKRDAVTLKMHNSESRE